MSNEMRRHTRISYRIYDKRCRRMTARIFSGKNPSPEIEAQSVAPSRCIIRTTYTKRDPLPRATVPPLKTNNILLSRRERRNECKRTFLSGVFDVSRMFAK